MHGLTVASPASVSPLSRHATSHTAGPRAEGFYPLRGPVSREFHAHQMFPSSDHSQLAGAPAAAVAVVLPFITMLVTSIKITDWGVILEVIER